MDKVAAHHDRWAETYDSDYFSGMSLYHRVTWDNIRRFLPDHPGALVLDAGGGTGIWAVEVARQGCRVVLLDASEGMLEKARQKAAELRASNRTPRESPTLHSYGDGAPRCVSQLMDARKGDEAVPGSGTLWSPDAADAAGSRNPQGRGILRRIPVSRRLDASDPLCAGARAPWPAAQSAPSRPRVVLLEAPDLTGSIQTLRGDICQMPQFADASFAMVLCQGDPLSYCGDHKAAMAEMSRVVRPGGAVLASVDARAAALNWIARTEDRDAVEKLLQTGDVMAPDSDGAPLYMVHAFTPAELRALYESNGLSVERLISKTVVAHRLACCRSPDSEVQDWLFGLELRHNEDPAFLPAAGHLEIAGCKR
jgi:ubiquinone/menaquinone biosynthesis C-methylase UbiE